MDNNMKKRWISLYVENQVGVLSKISGLFSGKSYNLDSLTVGRTEDPTVSRMTIATVSDDETFEQIKKQLNRMIEVIKVIDFTDIFVRMKEILYVKVMKCTAADKVEVFQIAETFKAKVIDYGRDSVLVEGGQADERRIQEHRGRQRRKRGDRIDQYDGALVQERRCRGRDQFRSAIRKVARTCLLRLPPLLCSLSGAQPICRGSRGRMQALFLRLPVQIAELVNKKPSALLIFTLYSTIMGALLIFTLYSTIMAE